MTATIATGDYGPYKLAVDSAHGTLYVTNLLGGTTGAESTSGMVIEEATNSVTGNFLTFGESRALGVDFKARLSLQRRWPAQFFRRCHGVHHKSMSRAELSENFDRSAVLTPQISG